MSRRISVTLLCAVSTPFSLNDDVSYPISHVTLTLDGVTSFQRVKNVTNICIHLRYSQTFGGISSVQWWKS